ncbi:MAG TPA: ABC transporter ATP-binding protein, partial [Salinisphaeraceae bacterium]|nr:ABC transporter ATP-binding protein [Salinisphaeraceae bacterium]
MSKRPEGLVEALPSLRRVLARLVPYMRGQRMLLAGSVTALLAVTGTKLLEPWPLKFIFDRVVPSVVGQEPAAAALAPLTLLALCAGGLIAIIGLKALFEYLSKVGFALAGNRIVTAVRNDLFRHLQTLSLRFHTRARTGDLAMRLVRDVGMLKETAVTAALPLIANAFILVGMVVVMLVLDWQLALLALSPLPLLWLLSVRLTRRIHSVSRTQRRREGEMASTGAETMAGIRTIQALGLEEQASEEFNAISGQDLRMSVQGTRLAALLERSVDLLTGLGLAIVLWFGTRQVLDGRLSPGDLLVFVTYLKNTFRPVRQYAKYTARLAKAAAAGERVVSVLDEVPEVRDTREAVAAHGLAGAVTFDHVQFSYRADTSILKDLSLHVAPGKTIAITGASGAGKSTLISLLLRLYDPTKGSVQIDGHDLRTLTLASLR